MNSKFEWQRVTPESIGMSTRKFEEQWETLKEKNTKAYLVVCDDKIVYEGYKDEMNGNKKHYTASMAKVIVAGLSLMLAMDDELISLEDYACKYIPQWQDHPLKSKITIRQLASHTSGLSDAEHNEIGHMDIPGWKGDFWRQIKNPFEVSRDEAPVLFTPGTEYLYSNPGIAMLTYAVTAALKNSEYKDIRSLLKERIFKPMGIFEDDFTFGYSKTFDTDGMGMVPSWGGGNITPYALAKIGKLFIDKGNWGGQQLISEKTIKVSMKHSGYLGIYGATWRINSELNGKKCWSLLPWDSAMAVGAGGQYLLVAPSRRLIVVRTGKDFSIKEENEKNFLAYIANPLMENMPTKVPYPMSKAITEIKWAPSSTIIRLATGGSTRDGSDNWPITWADDDNLYTAYGDGYGFEPNLPLKLSMGFGRIIGDPGDFVCENIRSGGETRGFGQRGEKSSGLLMVDGVLYLWMRNANRKGEHARLARSKDYSKSWEWCDWVFEEFGHITFVNYGKNYDGSRDDYVYMISHDHPSAYVEADNFILMRVKKELLTDKDAYEFFVETDEDNKPVWSHDVNKKGTIFTHKNSCRRASISYNKAIKRYLLWQQVSSGDGSDTRFEGGLGIYEAPEPWGPWSTVYFTEKWDVGPGDLGCFPTKWMSDDGKVVHMVFSGNDNFCVRKATLSLDDDIV